MKTYPQLWELCGKRGSITQVVSECTRLAQDATREEAWQNRPSNTLALMQVIDLVYAEKWNGNKMEGFVEDIEMDILWDFPVQTDIVLEHYIS